MSSSAGEDTRAQEGIPPSSFQTDRDHVFLGLCGAHAVGKTRLASLLRSSFNTIPTSAGGAPEFRYGEVGMSRFQTQSEYGTEYPWVVVDSPSGPKTEGSNGSALFSSDIALVLVDVNKPDHLLPASEMIPRFGKRPSHDAKKSLQVGDGELYRQLQQIFANGIRHIIFLLSGVEKLAPEKSIQETYVGVVADLVTKIKSISNSKILSRRSKGAAALPADNKQGLLCNGAPKELEERPDDSYVLFLPFDFEKKVGTPGTTFDEASWRADYPWYSGPGLLDALHKQRSHYEHEREKNDEARASRGMGTGFRLQGINVFNLGYKSGKTKTVTEKHHPTRVEKEALPQSTIICGRVLSGKISVGEQVALGPFPGSYDRPPASTGKGYHWSNKMSSYKNKGDSAKLIGKLPDSSCAYVTVKGIRHFDRNVESAVSGQMVGLRFDPHELQETILSDMEKKETRNLRLHTGTVVSRVRDLGQPAQVQKMRVHLLDFGAEDDLKVGRNYLAVSGANRVNVKLEKIFRIFNAKTGKTLSEGGSSVVKGAACEAELVPAGPLFVDSFSNSRMALHSHLGRLYLLDQHQVSAVGAVLGVEYYWDDREFLNVLMCLRRVFPFELAHYVTDYATAKALQPFENNKGKKKGKPKPKKAN